MKGREICILMNISPILMKLIMHQDLIFYDLNILIVLLN